MSILDWFYHDGSANSSLKLLENLDHAFAWKDPETGRYYTEVEYLKECAYPKGFNNVLHFPAHPLHAAGKTGVQPAGRRAVAMQL
jgi:hypothetical protein